MAGIRFRANTAQIATGTSAKTLAQIVAASNHRVLIDEIQVSFEGVSSTDAPIQVRVLKQTNAGTMTSLTLVKPNGDSETLQTTAQHTSTGEPTASDVIFSQFVHPQSAFRVLLAGDKRIVLKGGERLGVEVTATVSVDALVTISGEE